MLEQKLLSSVGHQPQLVVNDTHIVMVWEENSKDSKGTRIRYQLGDEEGVRRNFQPPENSNTFAPVVTQTADGFVIAFQMEAGEMTNLYTTKLNKDYFRWSMLAKRLPFMVLALLSLIVGLIAGLQRIGWNLSFNQVNPHHGAIMIGGFLGTLIAVEKVIPLKRKILYLIPVFSGGSVFFFVAGLGNYALPCLLIASLGLSITFFIYWTRQRSLIYLLMVIGAGCWLIGNILLLRTHFYPISISWWMAFVLLVITAERLELMKFLPVSQSKKNIFIALLILFLAGGVLSFHYNGNYFTGLALMGISVWLMKYDVIGINLKKERLVKYIGIALLSGYTALLLSGMFLVALSENPMGYDATLHSFFIGFVLAMIFAHGPIILPGVLGISLKPYHSFFYFWLLMLHLSWILRTVADIGLNMEVRQYSGWVSAIAVVGYFITLAFITIRSQREKVV